MATVIIVEGKHDRERLLEVIRADIAIVCTFGIPTQTRLSELNQQSEDADQVFIFTDNDRAGKRIRGILRDEFPAAIHLHTKTEYGGVEKTPHEYLHQLLSKHDLTADM